MPIYREKGDALKADKIVAQARRIDPTTIQSRTGKHKGQFMTLRDNAYCVIDIPLKSVLEKKS